MPTKILIRRGTGTPSGLSEGELAYSLDQGKLYIGTSTGVKILNSIESLSDLQITADATQLNTLNGIQATVNDLNILSGATVQTAELNVLHNAGITTANLQALQNVSPTETIQEQLDAKAAGNHTHTLAQLSNVSTTPPSDSDVLRYNVTSGLWEPSSEQDATLSSLGITATSIELNYVDGVTSNIQNQLNDKFDKTATGEVIEQDFKVGPAGALETGANSRRIIFQSDTGLLGSTTFLEKDLYTNNEGELIFDNSRVVTVDALAETYLLVDDPQTLTANQKEQALENLGVTATPTEINYLSGVQSAVQTQLSAKAPKLNPTFEGTVTLPNTGSGANEAATKSYVDTQISQNLSGSGVYTETVLANLETSGTFSVSGFSSYDKVFFTLYPVGTGNFVNGNFNAQTVPVFPSIELARLSNTIDDPSGAGTCIGAPQYDNDPNSCVIAGYAFNADQITYYQNGTVNIGPDGAYVRRVDSSNVQFIQPTPISGLTWKLRITGVTF